MKALAPLARDWVATAKVTGKASRIRALRGHKEAFTAIREAQTRWSRGEHGAAVLHDAASGAATLMLLVPRAFDADDRLDAHAIALSAADAAAGADVRGQQAVLALALDTRARRARLPMPRTSRRSMRSSLSIGASSPRQRDARGQRRRSASAPSLGDAGCNEQGLLRFIGATRDNEHISVPSMGLFLLDGDLQIVAAASDALPAWHPRSWKTCADAPRDVELVKILMSAQQSALQNSRTTKICGHASQRISARRTRSMRALCGGQRTRAPGMQRRPQPPPRFGPDRLRTP